MKYMCITQVHVLMFQIISYIKPKFTHMINPSVVVQPFLDLVGKKNLSELNCLGSMCTTSIFKWNLNIMYIYEYSIEFICWYPGYKGHGLWLIMKLQIPPPQRKWFIADYEVTYPSPSLDMVYSWLWSYRSLPLKLSPLFHNATM